MQNKSNEDKKDYEEIEFLMDSMKDCISDAHLEIVEILQNTEQSDVSDFEFIKNVIKVESQQLSEQFSNMVSIIKKYVFEADRDPLTKLKEIGKFKKVDLDKDGQLGYFRILDTIQALQINPAYFGGETSNNTTNAWMLALTNMFAVEIYEFETANLESSKQSILPLKRPESAFRQKLNQICDLDHIRGEIVAASTPGIISWRENDIVAYIVEPMSTKMKVIWFSKRQQLEKPSVSQTTYNQKRDLVLSLEFEMLAPSIVSVPDWDFFANKTEGTKPFLHKPRRLLIAPTGLLSLLSGPKLVTFFDITNPLNFNKSDLSLLCAPIVLKKSMFRSADVVDIGLFITYANNLDRNSARETLYYLLHKDQDYTELTVTLSSQTSDDKLSEKFKTTRRQVDIYPTENSKALIFTTSIHRFDDWIVISGRRIWWGIKLMPNKIRQPVPTNRIRENFTVMPLISARNEKTHALVNNLDDKEQDFFEYLVSGFKLFDNQESHNPLNTSKNRDLKLIGVSKTGHYAEIEIRQVLEKEVEIIKVESCFDRPEKLESPNPSFNNIANIGGKIIFSGGSKSLLKRNLPPTTNSKASRVQDKT